MTIIKNNTSGDNRLDIYIYGEIGFEVRSLDVVKSITSFNGDKIVLHINSIGGSCDEASAIFNAIKSFGGETEAIIEGTAASAATYIMLACKTIRAFENTFIFVHNPLVEWASGNANALETLAEELRKWEAGYVAAYMAKTGKDENEIRIIMDAETLFTAQEAKDFGLIDEVSASGEDALSARRNQCRFAAKMSAAKYFSTINKREIEMKEYTNWSDALVDLEAFAGKVEDEALKLEIEEIITGLKAIESAKGDTGEGGIGEGDTSAAQIESAVAKAVAECESKLSAKFDRMLAQGYAPKSKEYSTISEEYHSIKDENKRREFFAKNKSAILAGK